MARGTVEYLCLPELPRAPLDGFGLPLGWRGAVLSRDEESGAFTALVHASPLWVRPDAGSWGCGIELLVLAGSLECGEQLLAAGSYSLLAPESITGPLSSKAGVTLLLMTDGAPRFSAASASMADALTVLDARNMPWSDPPGFEGRSIEDTPPGLRTKWLRKPAPGGGPYALLASQSPGWHDPRLEAHVCWEELLLLQGDYLMGVNGAVDAGCYIFRELDIPHGPQATRTGSVWFCRGDRMIDFDLHETDWAPAQIAQFFDTPPPPKDRDPWGAWMEPAMPAQDGDHDGRSA